MEAEPNININWYIKNGNKGDDTMDCSHKVFDAVTVVR